MTKHTIEISQDTYTRFEELKKIIQELSNEKKLTDEDVLEFAVREILESIKMMQGHSHNHDWSCCGYEHEHHTHHNHKEWSHHCCGECENCDCE